MIARRGFGWTIFVGVLDILFYEGYDEEGGFEIWEVG